MTLRIAYSVVRVYGVPGGGGGGCTMSLHRHHERYRCIRASPWRGDLLRRVVAQGCFQAFNSATGAGIDVGLDLKSCTPWPTALRRAAIDAMPSMVLVTAVGHGPGWEGGIASKIHGQGDLGRESRQPMRLHQG